MRKHYQSTLDGSRSGVLWFDNGLVHRIRRTRLTPSGRVAPLVAVVDDDESVRGALIPALRSAGLQAVAFASAESFVAFDRLADVCCLITDLKMPGTSGLELMVTLRHEGYEIPTVIMTAHGASEARSQAMAAGAMAFLDKPFEFGSLLETLQSIITRRAPGESP